MHRTSRRRFERSRRARWSFFLLPCLLGLLSPAPSVAQQRGGSTRGARLFLEPFAARLWLDPSIGGDRQSSVGGRAGLGFGPFAVSGFYWWGTRDSYDALDDARSWGGTFRLAPFTSALAPFVEAGASRLEGVTEPDSAGASRRTAILLGGGLRLRVSSRLSLVAHALDHVIDSDTSEARRLTSNWGAQLGLRLTLGGSHGEGGAAVAAAPPPETAPVPEPIPTTAQPPSERHPAPAGAATPPPAVDSVDYAGERTVTLPVPRQGDLYVHYGPGPGSAPSPKTPAKTPAAEAAASQVPPAKALPGGADLREEIRSIVREELAFRAGAAPATVAAAPGGRLTAEQMDALEERITARVDALLATRLADQRQALTLAVRDELDRLRTEQQQAREAETATFRAAVTDALRQGLAASDLALTRVLVLGPAGDTVSDSLAVARLPAPPEAAPTQQPLPPRQPLLSWVPADVRVYTGMSAGGPRQALLGLRADFGRLSRSLPIHLVPELAIGAGGGATSYLVAGNAQYRFAPIARPGGAAVVPELTGGLGLLLFSGTAPGRPSREGVLNLGAGVAVDLAPLFTAAQSYGIEGILEYQGVDLFDLQRVLVGVRWAF